MKGSREKMHAQEGMRARSPAQPDGCASAASAFGAHGRTSAAAHRPPRRPTAFHRRRHATNLLHSTRLRAPLTRVLRSLCVRCRRGLQFFPSRRQPYPGAWRGSCALPYPALLLPPYDGPAALHPADRFAARCAPVSQAARQRGARSFARPPPTLRRAAAAARPPPLAAAPRTASRPQGRRACALARQAEQAAAQRRSAAARRLTAARSRRPRGAGGDARPSPRVPGSSAGGWRARVRPHGTWRHTHGRHTGSRDVTSAAARWVRVPRARGRRPPRWGRDAYA